MTVLEFLSQAIDIDVADDIDESLYIGFCGPVELTEAGKAEFGRVLDVDVEIVDHDHAIVHVDDSDEGTWKSRLLVARRLFQAAAGYCSESDFDKWFKED